MLALSLFLVVFIRSQRCKVVFVDFFGDECTEDAADECSEFRPVVPLSEEFNSTAFEHYCK